MTRFYRLLAASLGAAALASQAQPVSEPASERLGRELRTLIGPARCTEDTQCRAVAVGAKACGGPSAYWAWSTLGTDSQRLTDLAAQQAAAARRELVATGRMSHCAVLPEPAVACVARQCQVQTATASPSR